MSKRLLDVKFKNIYYSDGGYWKGKSAIEKLSKATNSNISDAEDWLNKQSLYLIYLPRPKYILRRNTSFSNYAVSNDVHQADLLFFPGDKYKGKKYKYALCVVDVGSRFKLTTH